MRNAKVLNSQNDEPRLWRKYNKVQNQSLLMYN